MLRIKNLNSLLYISLRPCFRPYSQQLEAAEPKFEEEEFRVLNFKKVKSQPVQRRRQKMPEVSPPRSKQMAIDQDWGAVWPAPRTFHPATVPLPLRQGYTKKNKAPPGKFANAELMKIPNFLHLTPPVIAKQCEALKKFCTPWPKGLETTENQEQHYPVQYMSSDYVHGSPSIRNPFSRIVTIKLKLKELNLDQHAQDKFLRLVGERYNSDTDELTIVTDRCPLRKQNYDYAIYLLTALYHESQIVEDWEKSKCEADMEIYDWHRNKSKVSSTEIINWGKSADQIVEPSPEYVTSVETMINEGENEYNLEKYKQQVIKMLGIA